LIFEAYGVKVGIRTNDPSIVDRLRVIIPPGAAPVSSANVNILYSVVSAGPSLARGIKKFNLLYVNDFLLGRDPALEILLELLESEMHPAIAEASRNRLFIHAGVVEWRGKALIMPGRSMSGKSNLVRAFLEAGGRLYSDEYAVVDGRGRIYPFARPISLRDADGHRIARLTAEDLGSSCGTKPIPIGMVLATTYRRGGSWRPRSCTPGQAALELLSNTLAARREPAKSLHTLTRIVASCPAYKGARGEAAGVVNWVNSLNSSL
jgi:hypothetical protein